MWDGTNDHSRSQHNRDSSSYDHEEHDCSRGHYRGGGRRRYFGRGGVKFALLELLTQQSMHGYQMMKALEEQSGGLYIPSAGTIYPTLQMLEDRSLITVYENEGKKVYQITDEGRSLLGQKPETEESCAYDRRPARGVIAADDLYRHERVRRKLGLSADSYKLIQQLAAAEHMTEGQSHSQEQLRQIVHDIQIQLAAFLEQHSDSGRTEAE
ncbi:PadR family transcriptional regulator [Paenibacillus oenotherae]|uniref:PadR family transcriptional regulator n=1 Tax=Paenibacillus oenotherae TaxID=1435645 RepID=A0ABS7DC98_9BACL|nr:PadR family transcriptional regulator [Paenibacillus oenotherae]MBW7477560.1 PadR family transcriptional regulator [Paenibacillus oenotherae]